MSKAVKGKKTKANMPSEHEVLLTMLAGEITEYEASALLPQTYYEWRLQDLIAAPLAKVRAALEASDVRQRLAHHREGGGVNSDGEKRDDRTRNSWGNASGPTQHDLARQEVRRLVVHGHGLVVLWEAYDGKDASLQPHLICTTYPQHAIGLLEWARAAVLSGLFESGRPPTTRPLVADGWAPPAVSPPTGEPTNG